MTIEIKKQIRVKAFAAFIIQMNVVILFNKWIKEPTLTDAVFYLFVWMDAIGILMILDLKDKDTVPAGKFIKDLIIDPNIIPKGLSKKGIELIQRGFAELIKKATVIDTFPQIKNNPLDEDEIIELPNGATI